MKIEWILEVLETGFLLKFVSLLITVFQYYHNFPIEHLVECCLPSPVPYLWSDSLSSWKMSSPEVKIEFTLIICILY